MSWKYCTWQGRSAYDGRKAVLYLKQILLVLQPLNIPCTVSSSFKLIQKKIPINSRNQFGDIPVLIC